MFASGELSCEMIDDDPFTLTASPLAKVAEMLRSQVSLSEWRVQRSPFIAPTQGGLRSTQYSVLSTGLHRQRRNSQADEMRSNPVRPHRAQTGGDRWQRHRSRTCHVALSTYACLVLMRGGQKVGPKKELEKQARQSVQSTHFLHTIDF